MSDVGIPDEAWKAVVEENGFRTWESSAAVEAAAPHIARAAQVQILRELLTLDRYDVHTREDVESWVQHRIYELEQS